MASSELQIRADPCNGDTMIGIFAAAEHCDGFDRDESGKYMMELEQLHRRCKELLAWLVMVEPLDWPKRRRKMRLQRLRKELLACLRMERLERQHKGVSSVSEGSVENRKQLKNPIEYLVKHVEKLHYLWDRKRYWQHLFQISYFESELDTLGKDLDALDKNVVSHYLQFSVTTPSKDGIEIETDCGIIHLPKYLSVRHPLIQMVLFAQEFGHKFVCLKSMALKSIIDVTSFRMFRHSSKFCCFQRCVSQTSVPPKNMIDVAEFSSRESTARSNEPLVLLLSADETSSISLPRCSGAFQSSTTDVDGNSASNNISVLSGESNGRSSSEGASSMLNGDNHHRGTDLVWNDNPVVILDSEAPETITGNLSVIPRHNGAPRPASAEETQTCIFGSVSFGRFKLVDVHYNPNVGNIIIVSGFKLDKLDYYFEFGEGKCFVVDLRTDQIIGEGRLVDNDYIMDYLEIPHNRTPGSEGQFSLV
ncbi:hypothetical protein ACP70R_021470 [Stipagrostis hirtigluma subsp. patula]